MSTEKTLKKFKTEEGTFELAKHVFGQGSPVCGVLSGVHGDEFLARKVAEHLKENLENHVFNGTVHIVSDANIFACDEGRRMTPWPRFEKNEGEMRDLNRCFKMAFENMNSKNKLNTTQLIAREILREFKKFDFVLDLHNATSGGFKVDQTRLKVSNGIPQETIFEMEKMAKNSGTDFVMRSAPSWLGGTVSSILPLLKVPVITFEVSGGSGHDEEDFENYLNYVENVLKFKGVLEGETVVKEPYFFDQIVSVYSDNYGHLRKFVDLGEFIDPGQTIAEVIDDEGNTVEKISSEYKGFIESITDSDKVIEGSRIVNIGSNGEGFK